MIVFGSVASRYACHCRAFFKIIQHLHVNAQQLVIIGQNRCRHGRHEGHRQSHCPGVVEPEMPSTILLKVENPPLRLPQGEVGQYAKGQERLTCAGRRGSLLNDWE